jgi:putative thioredoxin
MSTKHSADSLIELEEGSFEREVLERSRTLPVVVDFWAEWCAPCRLLGPILEDVAREYTGRIALAKANIDRLPEIAARFGVRSIPTVIGVVDGEVRDAFVGVLPAPAIREFFDRLLPSPVEVLVKRAAALEQGEPLRAEEMYREALALAPNTPAIQIALARLLSRLEREDESRAILEQLERRGFLEPEAERLKAEISLRAGANRAGSLDAARAAVEANAGDLGARFHLAEALAAAGKHEEALRLALELVEQDRRGVGEEARKLMLTIFSLLPADSPLAAEYRRQLSLVL